VGRGRQSCNPAVDADEKSDTPVVPKNLPNKGALHAEAAEGRGVAEGNAGEAPTHWTQSRGRVLMGLEGLREAAAGIGGNTPTRRCASRHDPRQEPYAVIPHVRICAGGGGQPPSLPRPPVSRRMQRATAAALPEPGPIPVPGHLQVARWGDEGTPTRCSWVGQCWGSLSLTPT
jgi:hypothetical protein